MVKIICNGKPVYELEYKIRLDENMTMKELHVKAGALLYAVLNLKGGS